MQANQQTDNNPLLVSHESILVRVWIVFFAVISLLQQNYSSSLSMLVIGIILAIFSPKIVVYESELTCVIFGKQFHRSWSQILRVRRTPGNTQIYLSRFPFVIIVMRWRPTYKELVRVLGSWCAEKYYTSPWI